jgi:hypothetical protein
MFRLSPPLAALAASLGLATAAAGAAGTATRYEAGSTANGPFAVVTVVHHTVTTVRWRFLQSHCQETVATPGHATATLDARIGPAGHFARTVRNPFGGTTAFSGRVTAARATVRIVNHDGPAYASCSGTRTFHARRVSRVR